jgi:hypothetical protein
LANVVTLHPMPPRSCRVSLEDPNGVEHAVEVLAESLFEAAALGLALLKKDAWIGQDPGPLTRVRVEVREPAVEHSLTVQQLKRWAERTPTSPAERIKKDRLKALLAAGWSLEYRSDDRTAHRCASPYRRERDARLPSLLGST